MTRRVSVVAMMVFACLCAVPAAAQDDGDSGFDPQRLDRLWRGQWRSFAGEYFMYEGQAYVLRNYKPRATSSLPHDRGKLAANTLEMTWRTRRSNGFIANHSRTVGPHADDITYALNVLPRIDRGHFGHILFARYTHRIDDNTVLVDDLRLIDAEALRREKTTSLYAVQRELSRYGPTVSLSAEQVNDLLFTYRSAIADLPTQPILITGLRPDQMPPTRQSITGPLQIVLIDRGRGLEGVPMSLVRPGLTEEQFIAMLESRGKSKEEFSMMIAMALDRRLPTQQRDRAIRRYLEDYDPEPVRVTATPVHMIAPTVAGAAPGTFEVPTPPPAATTRPRHPALAATAGPSDTPAATPPRPQPKPRRTVDSYLDDPWEEPDAKASTTIFEFGRDL